MLHVWVELLLMCWFCPRMILAERRWTNWLSFLISFRFQESFLFLFFFTCYCTIQLCLQFIYEKQAWTFQSRSPRSVWDCFLYSMMKVTQSSHHTYFVSAGGTSVSYLHSFYLALLQRGQTFGPDSNSWFCGLIWDQILVRKHWGNYIIWDHSS